MSEAQPFQVSMNPVQSRTGGNCHLQVELLRLGTGSLCTPGRGGWLSRMSQSSLTLFLRAAPGGRLVPPGTVRGRPADQRHPERNPCLFPRPAWEAHNQTVAIDRLPGLVLWSFRIDNHSVEIKDDGFKVIPRSPRAGLEGEIIPCEAQSVPWS